MTTGVLGLYPSTPHEVDLRALRVTLNNRDEKTIFTEELFKMVEYMFKNIYFGSASKIKGLISRTVTGTKFSTQSRIFS